DAAGESDLGNSEFGVLISGSAGNTIGGTTAAAGNVISSNKLSGILLFDSGATGNLLEGNLIGTDVTGAANLGNSQGGVVISGAPGNTVGGTLFGAGNVISGNNTSGVEILGSGATGNLV